jgi:hypothetical protein
MKKKILVVLLTVLIIVGCTNMAYASSPFVETEGLSIDEFFEGNHAELIARQAAAHERAEAARAMGYPEDCCIIKCAQREWQMAQKERELLNTEDNYNTWAMRFAEYPYATYVWLYLTRTLEYNDYVAAGIIGNMMAEVGGGTLSLQYWLYGGGRSYYGICQWAKIYSTLPDGSDLRVQLEYLKDTIEYELNTFGFVFAYGYKYKQFLELTNTNDTALMFAKCYERCAAFTYYSRQVYAAKAYDYFVD